MRFIILKKLRMFWWQELYIWANYHNNQMFCQILFKANLGIVVVLLSCQNAVQCLLGTFHTWCPPITLVTVPPTWLIVRLFSHILVGRFCSRMPLVHSFGNLIARLHMHPDTCASSRLCQRTSLGRSGSCPSTVQTDGVILSDVWAFVSTQSTDLYKRIKVENISQMWHLYS